MALAIAGRKALVKGQDWIRPRSGSSPMAKDMHGRAPVAAAKWATSIGHSPGCAPACAAVAAERAGGKCACQRTSAALPTSVKA
jgi:hypothetical protein